MTHSAATILCCGVSIRLGKKYTFCRNEKNVLSYYRHSPKGFDADPSPPQSHRKRMPNMFRSRLLLLFLSFSLSLSWSTENNIIGAFSSSSSSSSTSSVRHQRQRRTQWDPSACKRSKNASTLSGCQKFSATSTTKSMYYTNSTKGSNTALDITLGTIAGIVCLFGLLFLVDRELYYTVVIASGERIIPTRLRGDAILEGLEHLAG